MSIRLMTAVWDIPWPSQSALLIALKLADHGNDNGRMIRPSRQRLADSCQTSLATVKRTLAGFVAHDVLTVVKPGGKGPGNSTEYAFNMKTLWLMSEGVIKLVGSAESMVMEQLKPVPDDMENKRLTVSLLSEKEAQADEQAAQNDEIRGSYGEPQYNHLEPSLRTKKIRSSIGEQKEPPKAAASAAVIVAPRVIHEITPDTRSQWNAWISTFSPDRATRAIEAGRILATKKWPGDGAEHTIPGPEVGWIHPPPKPSAMPAKGGAA